MNTFIQVLLGLTEVLTVLQCSLKSTYTNSQIYPLLNIFPAASRFLYRTSHPTYHSTYRFTYSASLISPKRSGPQLAQPIRPMLSLTPNTPLEAQLEALRDHYSGSSWLHASLALLDLFDSTGFNHSGHLVYSHGPFQLS